MSFSPQKSEIILLYMKIFVIFAENTSLKDN